MRISAGESVGTVIVQSKSAVRAVTFHIVFHIDEFYCQLLNFIKLLFLKNRVYIFSIEKYNAYDRHS